MIREHGEPTMTYPYGGNACCEHSSNPENALVHYAVTQSNGIRTSRILTCVAHRDDAAQVAVRYVHGWGDLTVSVERIDP